MLSLRLFLDDLRGALWFRSTVWVLVLGLLALALITLDQQIDQAELYRVLPWLFVDGVDGARTMLGAISAAMLTVTTLAFSIMMVAIVQTANAYSPRILRQYLADTSNQHVLGILLGTFIYALIVLRVVRSTSEGEFVPTLAVSVALALTLLCIASFIYFIHHVSHSIEVSTIIARLRQESVEILPSLFPSTIGQPWEGSDPPPRPAGTPGLVRAKKSGYIEAVHPHLLMDAACEANVVVELLPTVGDFVLPFAPLAHLWPAEALLDDHLTGALEQAVQRGDERTLVQDLHYGIRQLADMALRALSPAVNDPTTAINCLDAMMTLIVRGCQRANISPYRCDESGTLRIIARGPTFASMLDLAFIQLRHYTNGDPLMSRRMIEILGETGLVVDEAEEHAALWTQLEMVARMAARTVREPLDRAMLNETIRRAAERIEHDGATPLIAPQWGAE